MTSEQAVKALAALGQERRLAIYRELVQAGISGRTFGHLADVLKIPAASLNHHLKKLEQAELITISREGVAMRQAVHFGAMNALIGYLTDNCCGGKSC